jgi:predicted transcriptional regulator
VFKGREARLNRAVIWAFGVEEPQTTRQLHQKIIQIKELRHTSYSTINKRVRSLEQSGYLKKVVVKQRPGGYSNYYELRLKAILAKYLDSKTIENLFEQVNDQSALAILGDLIGT